MRKDNKRKCGPNERSKKWAYCHLLMEKIHPNMTTPPPPQPNAIKYLKFVARIHFLWPKKEKNPTSMSSSNFRVVFELSSISSLLIQLPFNWARDKMRERISRLWYCYFHWWFLWINQRRISWRQRKANNLVLSLKFQHLPMLDLVPLHHVDDRFDC